MTRPKSSRPYPGPKRAARKPAKVAEAALALPVHPADALTTMPAGLFKARCLELMDRVQAEGGEIVITKFGRPVAKLVPVSPAAGTAGFGALRGTVRRIGDIVSPVDEPWEADDA